MLKIFTLKYEERTESFNDSVMSNFLANERKNEYSWTVLVEYRPAAISQTEPVRKTEKGRDESYKEMLTENDLPICNYDDTGRALSFLSLQHQGYRHPPPLSRCQIPQTWLYSKVLSKHSY